MQEIDKEIAQIKEKDMPKVIYIDHEGTETTVDAVNGYNAMESALNNGVPGIDGDCGGSCACATCHVFVDESYLPKLPEQEEMETSILECSEYVQKNSRLACQIVITDELEGMRLTTPEIQG